jgi:RNA polymerase sigma factor (TIGR02999 family)
MASDKNVDSKHLLDRAGDEQAGMKELFELLYDELQKIAHARRREWDENFTINTTGLLHETYLKLIESEMAGNWKSKKHFYASASRAMRHILINYARDRNRLKRGGEMDRISLVNLDLPHNGEIEISDDKTEMLILLGDALQKLDDSNPRLSRIIECRFFGGMTIQETADVLGVSPITVTRGWNTARLWLSREITNEAEP